jgi:hypothetical protein
MFSLIHKSRLKRKAEREIWGGGAADRWRR